MPDSIKKLIESFKMLPGIGEKTAERLAFSVLDFDEDQIKLFSDSISLVNKNIHKCSICNTLTENDVCFVCNDDSRNDSVLCVVDVIYIFLRHFVFIDRESSLPASDKGER